MTGAATGPNDRTARPLPALRTTAPRVPVQIVRRRHLEELLDEGVALGVVVLSAPAGSGKTMLLAGWAARCHPPAGWLSMEPEDADPQHFWGRVLTALQAAEGTDPHSALADLQVPPIHDPRFVPLLVDAIEQEPEPRVLVLDDLHLLSGTPVVKSLAAVVRRGPGNLRLVISTRSDPELPLQKLRLSGQLTEIRAADLRFNTPHAAELLAAHDVVLRADQLAILLAKTEGWAAGLRLAALSLQTSEDTEATVRQLAGEQRTVADYFMEEVLGRQEPKLTRFLLDTCIVRHICGDLADALTGRRDGQRMLTRLEHENLFLIALDDRRRWFRYQQLFEDLLRHELMAQDPSRRRVLHRRAATWFAAHGDPLEAARHLQAGEDWIGLSRIVLRSAGAQMPGVDRSAFMALLEELPANLVAEHAELAVAAAVVSEAEYDPVGVAAHTARARELLPELDPRQAHLTEVVLAALDAALAWMRADAAGQVRCARDAIRKLDEVVPQEMPSAPVYRIAVSAVLAMGELWAGELDEAEETLAATSASLPARSTITTLMTMQVHGHMALLRAVNGRLQEARREVNVALTAAEESGWTYLPLGATAYLGEALIGLLEGDFAACALAQARGRVCLGRLSNRYVETGLELVGARLEVSRSDPTAARSAMGRMWTRMGDWQMPGLLEQWCRLVEAEILLAEGRPAEARALLNESGTDAVDHGRLHGHRAVLVARSHLVANEPRECLDLLGAELRQSTMDRGPAAEAWLLVALAHDRLRQDAHAQHALARSLTVAASEGIVRPFLLNGEAVLRLLLRQQRNVGAYGDFVAMLVERLRGAAPPPPEAPLVQQLTDREWSALVLLPTMMSNAEIAEVLYLSVNTVKVHLKTLYRKLNVSTRRQAVARAEELGLLDDPSGRRGPTVTPPG